MRSVTQLWHSWNQDRLLRTITRNTGYLFSGNTIGMVLSSAGGILAAYLLGAADYGVLGLVILFASSVNRLLSFRMGEVVVKYAGQDLATGQRERAAALIKAAGATEALTSVIAYLLLALLAPLAAAYIVKEPASVPWIRFYGLALLANLVTETGTAVLQLGNHYRSQAALTLAQSLVTTVWIGVTCLTGGGVMMVLCAYLAGKAVFGLGILVNAWRWLTPLLGQGWWRTPLARIENRRAVMRFAISTNLSGTVNMILRDSEVLWVGFFFGKLEAGYYKFALAIMNIILMPITPFVTTTFPEISRSVATRSWQTLRAILRRTTWIAAGWTILCGVGAAALGPWLLGWFKQGQYLPSYAAILILLVGYGVANTFFWNRPLLLAFGLPDYPLLATLAVGTVKTALMFVLVQPLGFLAQAALLSGYFVFSVGLIVRRGLAEVRRAEAADAAEAQA